MDPTRQPFNGNIDDQIEALLRMHKSLTGKSNKRARQKINDKIKTLEGLRNESATGLHSGLHSDGNESDSAGSSTGSEGGSPAESPAHILREFIPRMASATTPPAPLALPVASPPGFGSGMTSRKFRAEMPLPTPFTYGLSIDLDALYQ
eukprot:m.432332 g.432332  ORF g.432332 m.432332 type:complete len:149 (+) comp17420_c0_seq1:221-667(+)